MTSHPHHQPVASSANGLRERDAPLVAILTPVYNGEKFLAETMECVQRSDYPNLVHVIVDNASTDSTPEIIERYKNQRVKVISWRNPHTIVMNDNFNAVAEKAPDEAKYVRFLCADDIMAPSAISKMVEIAERDDGVSVVGCQCRNIGILGWELPRDRTVFPGTFIVRAYLRRETMVLSGTHFLFRTAILRECWPPYDTTLTSGDNVCAIKAALRGRFGFVHEMLAEFRHHAEGHSLKVAARKGDHLFEWLVVLDRYGQQVMTNSEYRKCRRLYRRYFLRRALLPLLKHGDYQYFLLQVRRLADLNDPAGPVDFTVALLEWLFFAVTRQRNRVGAPLPLLLSGRRKRSDADLSADRASHELV